METFSALLALCELNPPVTGGFPSKGQWPGAFMFSLICAWINCWANNQDAGDLRYHRAHYDVTVLVQGIPRMHTVRILLYFDMACYRFSSIFFSVTFLALGSDTFHSMPVKLVWMIWVTELRSSIVAVYINKKTPQSSTKHVYILWYILHIDGLAQYCSNSSALAMELLQSCAKPSICQKPRTLNPTDSPLSALLGRPFDSVSLFDV